MSIPLQALRQRMAQHKVHAVLVPSGDFHSSEYTTAYFAARAYLSGFTGSAGTLLVLADWAGLWTDGRYFLQAERQLQNTGITLMRQGQLGVLTVEAFLADRLEAGQCLAFDGRCVSARTGASLQKRLTAKGCTLRTDLDLPGEIWPDRPPLSAQPAWALDASFAGETRAEKLRRVREKMAMQGADQFLLTALEDIGWLLNLRGGDIDCTPVVLAYLALEKEHGTLFVNPAVFPPGLIRDLEADGIALAPYETFYAYAASIPANSRVLLDRRRASFHLLEQLPKDTTILDRSSPTEAMKAIKNETEIENMRRAHLMDGVALTKFIYWLKSRIRAEPITERSATRKLEALRQEQPHYLGPSFSPILAYGPHGAIVHYAATEESDAALTPEGFLLADTGGHYLEGTTDCTRTLALGPLSQEQKTHYTAVLRGNLNLGNAQFLSGCTGVNLDYLAKAPLWALGLDFNHGTGHGVGYLLSVHEGPQGIRMKSTSQDVPFEAGMITSDEPGLYLEGQYGIRLENLLLCIPRGETAFGRFLGFAHLTLVPFDLDAVRSEQMTREEVALLNCYHKRVYEALFPHLDPHEAAWLAHATRPIS